MSAPHVPTSGAFANQPPRVERYTCLDRLGAGGMGQVWRAHDQVLHRDVALKTVPRDAPADHAERLRREARIAAQLDVPGVVRVLDQAELSDGRPFLVMELLRTPALGHGRDHDLRVLLEVARAVGEAHRQGIVHRDLKPSNLALRGEQAVVLDWGLARPVDPDAGWSQRVLTRTAPLTQSGVSLGTPGYMAPEQVAGAAADPRSDVWSLAAMVHEVLSGTAAHAHGGHRLLAEVTEGRLRVPRGPLGEVVRRGISLDPGERPPDAHALADALEAALPRPLPWRAIGAVGAGLALAAGVAALAAIALPDVAGVDPLAMAALRAEHGWLLYDQGRVAEARAAGAAAEALASTPEGIGLLMLPPTPEGRAVDPPCNPWITRDGSPLSLCGEGDELVLLDRGVERWRRPMPEGAWAGRDRVAVHEDWWVRVLDREGRTLAERDVRSLDEVHLGERATWLIAGPSVFPLGDTTPGHVATVEGSTPTPGVEVPAGFVISHGDQLQLVDGDRLRPIAPLAEPLVLGARVGDEALLVGLRGTVIHLDADTLEVRRRYRLQGVTQVEDAAWTGDGLAVATPDGAFLFRGSRVEHQLAAAPHLEVVVGPDLDLIVYGNGGARRWGPVPSAHRALVNPAEASVEAMQSGTDPAIAVDRTLHLVDPVTLTTKPRLVVPSSPVRSVLLPHHAVSGSELFHVDGQALEPLGTWPLAVPLPRGRVLAAGRWKRGVAVVDGTDVREIADTPVLRTLVPLHDGSGALGVTDEGDVARVSADGAVTSLGLEGVTLVASSPAGPVLARDRALSLDEAWTVELGDEITALGADRRFVLAGTRAGDVYGYDLDGQLIFQLAAHPEQVSVIQPWADHLFTGSWAPGLRRWDLPTVSP